MYVVVVALDFKGREDLEDTEEDLGEEVDLVFFRFCFCFCICLVVVVVGGGGQSLNISDTECCPMDCSKSDLQKNQLIPTTTHNRKNKKYQSNESCPFSSSFFPKKMAGNYNNGQ